MDVSTLTSLEANLEVFRSAFRRVRVEQKPDTAWTYWRGGESGEAVLWLTGALGVGEFAFLQALALAPDFRVVVPDYPPVASLGVLARGLVGLLDTEGIGEAHVVGGSFGGMVAQHLVRAYPSRVRSVVLSHTVAPHPSTVRSALIRATSMLPERLYRTLFSRRLRKAFSDADPFWVTFFDSTVATLSKADLVSRVRLADEFLQTDLLPVSGGNPLSRVLLVQSDNDPMMPAAAQSQLWRLYPTAETHTFSGTGHAAPIICPEEYLAVIRRFIATGES